MNWTKHRADSNTILIKDKESRTVARIIHPQGDDQAEREASLITAAPDMLAALKETMDDIGYTIEYLEPWKTSLHLDICTGLANRRILLRAVVAKAEAL